MNIIVSEDTRIKKLSIEKDMPFSNILWGYMVDDLLQRLYTSEYQKFFWLANPEGVGLTAYRDGKEHILRFVYCKSEKKVYGESHCPGQPLSEPLLNYFMEQVIFTGNRAGIQWEGSVQWEEEEAVLQLTGTYDVMKVPIRVSIQTVDAKDAFSEPHPYEALTTGHPVILQIYSVENTLCKNLNEILYKLELISDMSCYEKVNQILKKEAISGRRVLEQFLKLHTYDEKFYVEKRMTQLLSYGDYSYMRKRWEQLGRKKGVSLEPWETVVNRLGKFLAPIWEALCKKEVFFDDWMPELQRYLG